MAIMSIVEKKTFDNFLTEFGRMQAFHQQLGELSAYKNSALVIEVNYSNFLNPNKVKFYTPSFTSKAIAELYALHPKLTIVFAGNRKLANEWAYRFFCAITAHEEDKPHEIVSDIIENYSTSSETTGGIYFEIKKKITNDFPVEFTLSMIKETFPDATLTIIRKAVNDLKKEGVITQFGEGKKSYWIKCGEEI